MTDATVSRRTVHVVPHTHWDREWYEPFQRFRLQLVDLLDTVLPRLEADPRFRFTLDGQTAAVDDYLEVRPDALPRVIALVRSGQLAVGPWRVLADSFLCSGENLVRNLEIGLARSAELGGAMRVGYIPDQFGHTAQLPQILRGFGFDQACLWRGVPGSVDRHAFRWVSPDGSAVRTEYLPGGYGNASVMFTDPAKTVERSIAFAEQMRAWFGDTEPLAMYGTDHSAPIPTLLDQVGAVQASGAEVTLRLETLAEALAGRDPEEAGLPEVLGELRSHARANLLPGILSVRIAVKQAMAEAERMVERYAEPLSALWCPQAAEPFLSMAWLRLVDASCHDSVTGCGADTTAQQVAARIAEAEQLGSAVRDRTLNELAATAPSDSVLVVNPSAHERTDLVRCQVVAPEEWSDVALELPDGTLMPTQEIGRAERNLIDATFPAADVVNAVRRRTFGQVMYSRAIQRAEISETMLEPASGSSVHTVTFTVGRMGDPGYDVERFADELTEAVAAATPGDWRLRVIDEPSRELLALATAPALGWTTVRPRSAAAPLATPVSIVDNALHNGLVSVVVNEDGTLRITGADGTVLDGVGRIVDGGDAGDSYNYGPPVTDTLVDKPTSVSVVTAETGPLQASLVVLRTYEWPLGLVDFDGTARTSETVSVGVTTRVELRVDEPFVRVEVSFDNRSVDHRVRFHIPTVRTATSSHAEGQFSVVERALVNEGGNGEHPLPTFPASSFVDAGGTGVLLQNVTEYEVSEDGSDLALTLLRATGAISRNLHPLRAEPAGPTTPIPEAQVPGVTMSCFAILPHTGDWASAGLVEAAERYRNPLITLAGTGNTDDLTSGEGITVTGATACGLRQRNGLELRLVAYSDSPSTATVSLPGLTAAARVDLTGAVVEELSVVDGAVELPMRAWEITGLRLTR
ncbi:glycoside hydrolase family 38 N-terminal domain-containing protein [Allokutzneria albata]|uniref:glycoside hydrolase family 38 N-terminal domain-containing protein n=1 Tax=Allokutzneria albata TaxID=211114 RepID=UPI0006944326|nr:glycoside hydrolase family 38 C-terminal domain-containing protein [Allokutzneria albata]